MFDWSKPKNAKTIFSNFRENTAGKANQNSAQQLNDIPNVFERSGHGSLAEKQTRKIRNYSETRLNVLISSAGDVSEAFYTEALKCYVWNNDLRHEARLDPRKTRRRPSGWRFATKGHQTGTKRTWSPKDTN
ncbi:unnamed protein product [Nesidiocoris tenuis]|uniref:Uncharacterized protein n=1 Tax=Nesidiocoris tenuis TaxID=355587 RepID=A0A6H5HE35_9HEMI|nr:unnamed protein product [Nesidiocoris tenuis]